MSNPISIRRSRRRRAGAAVAAVALGAAAFATVGVPTAAAEADHGYHLIKLVSDQPGKAQVTDPNLVNAWGMSAGPATPIWVSDNGSGNATLYRGATMPGSPVSIVPLVVSIPGSVPTGQVFNTSSDFVLPTGGKALFIFAGEDGSISAWNQAQGSAAALVVPSAGGVYKGLALDPTPAGNWLLAANFHDNRIDVFDSSFAAVHDSSLFRSVGIPHNYAPFDVAVIGDRVYVTYAEQNAARHDDVAGAGHGFVNVFSLSGRFLRRLVTRGVLNSPWGMVQAPPGFGEFAGDLLIGNFGDGRIYAFDRSGEREGTLRAPNGRPVVIDGLWGLHAGNGVAGATSDVWFSAGPGGEAHGLLGILRPAED